MMLQYDSDEIGELNDEIGGVVENVEDELLDDFITTSETKYVPGPNVTKEADDIIQITKCQINRQLREEASYDTDEDNRALEEECRPKEVEQWDCESILSTLSNVENHPRVIKEPKRFMKTNVLSLPIAEDQKLPDDVHPQERCNLGERRPCNETNEERRARKKAVREARQQRRSDKKQLKLSFTAKHTAKCKNDLYQKVHNSASIRL
ncbi:hypothetical protein BVRB_025760 [Beta vulgaris subsp. vulgaris]|uniref:Uncharacterized protein n=1 Tax=Beta vulgaris subsp. vulgaris TaxID=3555 RepID=A0A0J8AZ23_BETVV|nr:hypothetical protein BVRB_025760 [Beta vulgaris subsp. vulgaris]